MLYLPIGNFLRFGVDANILTMSWSLVDNLLCSSVHASRLILLCPHYQASMFWCRCKYFDLVLADS